MAALLLTCSLRAVTHGADAHPEAAQIVRSPPSIQGMAQSGGNNYVLMAEPARLTLTLFAPTLTHAPAPWWVPFAGPAVPRLTGPANGALTTGF